MRYASAITRRAPPKIATQRSWIATSRPSPRARRGRTAARESNRAEATGSKSDERFALGVSEERKYQVHPDNDSKLRVAGEISAWPTRSAVSDSSR